MLDIAAAYNRYKFLGKEFLTWLWFMIETDPDGLRKFDPEMLALEIGSRLVVENSRTKAKETVTIKGDEASLEEGLLALKKGAKVTDIHLIYRVGSQEYQFSLKGESLNISNLKLPETGAAESTEDMEGIIIEKIYLAQKAIGLVDALFTAFVKLRLSDHWRNEALPAIRKWVAA